MTHGFPRVFRLGWWCCSPMVRNSFIPSCVPHTFGTELCIGRGTGVSHSCWLDAVWEDDIISFKSAHCMKCEVKKRLGEWTFPLWGHLHLKVVFWVDKILISKRNSNSLNPHWVKRITWNNTCESLTHCLAQSHCSKIY